MRWGRKATGPLLLGLPGPGGRRWRLGFVYEKGTVSFRGAVPFFHGGKEVETVQDLLVLERGKEEYARLERRGIPMSVREWYEGRLARLRSELRSQQRDLP